jgi:hypothetical protein
VAITPDQAPLASFPSPGTRVRPGVSVVFNASASSDPDGSIARYDWEFGDGTDALNGGPTPSHIWARPGSYRVKLTATDNEGCSSEFVTTGQTAYCNGQPTAGQTQVVSVAYPGVRVKCPKSAKPKPCTFRLQAITKRRKGKPESAPAKVSVKPGKAAVVSLKPKKKYRTKLAAAAKILVRRTSVISGVRRTGYTKLKVVR